MTNEENNNNEQKQTKKNNLLIIISVLLLIIIAIGAFLIYNKYHESLNKAQKSEETESKEPENPNKYSLTLYNCESDHYIISDTKSEDCHSELYKVPTETKTAKLVDYDNDEKDIVLIQDNGLKIYNHNTDKIEKIDLEHKYKNYELNVSDDRNSVIGIILNEEKEENDYTYSYYNLQTKQELYKGEYQSLYSVSENYLEGEKTNDTTTTFDLLSTKEENTLKSLNSEDYIYYYEVITSLGNYLIINYTDGIGSAGNEYVIYISQSKSQFKAITNKLQDKQYSISNDGKLYVQYKSSINVFNPQGTILNTYNIVGDVLYLYNKFYLTINNNKLYLIKYGEEEPVELLDWDDKKVFHSALSHYYSKDVLNENNEVDKKAGYYFIIANDSEMNNDGENPITGVEIYYNYETGEITKSPIDEVPGYEKPILYLYPEKETKVEVTFANKDSLTTTYPKYKDKWEVTAKPNGDLYDKDGKYYYGLYWEEDLNHLVSFDTGFYVTKDNAISFLEEKLTTIGLNDRERNEFIMYWLPILEKNEQSLVYFELTEERDSYNKLNITPQPDSLLRVAIHVKKVNQKVNIKEQKLPTFKRNGFVAVEWGGIVY